MVKNKTVDEWNLPCFAYTLKEGSIEIDVLHCRICKYYYGVKKNLNKLQGRSKSQLRAYIDGTTTVKKCNAVSHVATGGAHETAVLAVSDNPPQELEDLFKQKKTASSTGESTSATQSTIRTMFRNLTVINKQQLLKKFQLAHFVGVRALSTSMYEHIAKFEKDVHGVDLGGGYLTRTACTEIIHFLAKNEMKENITEPLNSGKRHYYSLLSDGSSNAKTMDEKELVLIKTCDDGRPVFHVLGLQVVEEGNAPGIANAIQDAVNKASFTFDRREKEIGLCTDGAAVNVAAAGIIRRDLDTDDDYVNTLCPAHKIELAIENAFDTVPFNKDVEKDLVDIYYFFKKANLKWRLFKRQALFMEARHSRYKRPTGTRWVEHQVMAIDSYLKNLPVLIGFFNQQISAPHNTSMKKCVPRLQGLEEQTAKVEKIVFMAVKQDILEMIRPLSKVLQDNDLLTPELLTAVTKCTKGLGKVEKLIRECGPSAFSQFGNVFPSASGVITQLQQSHDIIYDRSLRSRAGENTSSNSSINGFRLRGNLETAIKKAKDRIETILVALVEVIKERFGAIIEDPIFKAMAVLLDTASYGGMGEVIILDKVREIVTKFRRQLDANGYDDDSLENELQTVLTHVAAFLSNVSPSKAWNVLFKKRHSLGITNLLHIAELCIVMPLGNAEVERIFSLLWRLFCKERSSLSNKVQEDLLRLRGTVVSKEVENYADAIELFLTEYPDGIVRRLSRRPSGHSYPKQRKSLSKRAKIDVLATVSHLVSSDDDDDSSDESDSNSNYSIGDIDLDEISDDSDEWSSDEEIV